jgi:hypothetical protein
VDKSFFFHRPDRAHRRKISKLSSVDRIEPAEHTFLWSLVKKPTKDKRLTKAVKFHVVDMGGRKWFHA